MRSTSLSPDPPLHAFSSYPIGLRLGSPALIRGGLICFLSSLLITGLLYQLLNFDLLRHLPPHTICLFNIITGYPCPGCGMFRGLVCLAQLRWIEAISYHPFSPFVLLGLLGFAFPGIGLQKRFTEKVALLFLVILIIFWIVRLCNPPMFSLPLQPL